MIALNMKTMNTPSSEVFDPQTNKIHPVCYPITDASLHKIIYEKCNEIGFL